MAINKVNGVTGNYSLNKNEINKPLKSNYKDKINISKDALDKIQWEKSFKIAKNSPEVRPYEIAAAKSNIDEHFVNGKMKDKVADQVAKKIVDSLFL